jgi:2-amino-4-hydroxy-6-hydroxymethyldihydropteridine diphosphokinase
MGSNLGDRVGILRQALDSLERSEIRVRRVSSFYETEPLDFRAQPWFINCVAEVTTDLLPLRLLRRLQAVERALGRRPGVSKGPRAIDIDILFYGKSIIRAAGLIVPHERLEQRRFVLVPLKEIAPALRHPVTDRTVSEMLANTADQSRVSKLRP